ncbi:MAG: tripartite tricarboxylate transporter substrate binding protein [Betaproteobacteria bacterium]|nr:MAG: tripartite tricarboxylate transporter substrate binding protein [Betaproteobacteria bacterium]
MQPIQTARCFFSGVALATFLAALPCLAQAQYPSRPIRMVIGYSAGGPADALARTIAPRLATHLGQPVIVENRPGADANIAMETVVRAAPDGHTVLLESSAISMNPTLYRKLPFDPVKDLAPITLIGGSPLLFVVHPSVPAQTLGELMALAKSKKGQLFYGSTSTPIHLATAMFNSQAGIELVRVPYKGAGAAIPALLAGDVQVMLSSIGPLWPHVKAGKVRALAVSSAKRTALAPDMPTVDEAGVPGYSAMTWYGLFVPVKTPRSIVDRLNSDTRKVLAQPEVTAALSLQSLEPTPTTPEELGEFVRTETEKWGKVIKESGMQVSD